MRRYEAILHEFMEAKEKGIALSSHQLSIQGVKTFTPQEIKQIRVNANMTQWMFASVIGVTQKSVEAWEGGRSRPDGAARRMIGLLNANPHFAEDVGIIQAHSSKTR